MLAFVGLLVVVDFFVVFVLGRFCCHAAIYLCAVFLREEWNNRGNRLTTFDNNYYTALEIES